MLEPARQPHHAVADAEILALLGLEPLVRGRRWMRDQALGVAEIIGNLDVPPSSHYYTMLLELHYPTSCYGFRVEIFLDNIHFRRLFLFSFSYLYYYNEIISFIDG